MRRSVIEYVESKQMRTDIADFRTGDTVRVHWKVKEGDKERVQPFEGIVIRKTKGQNRATFTVRKISYGVGVERIFPLHSPRYEKIEVLTHGNVHRNRLFFLRKLKGKASRVATQDELEVERKAPSAPKTLEAAKDAASPTSEAAANEPAPAPKPKKSKAAVAPARE
jgi:large subunit ribosomal protein L19